MDSFDHIWLLLNPQGEYKRRKEVCRRLWQDIGENLGEDMQRDIWRTINQKMKQGFFVHPNPYFAIEDAKLELQRKAQPKPKPTGPTFLHGEALGKALKDHIPLVQVDIPDRPEGRYPVCTRADAEKYGLTIYKAF